MLASFLSSIELDIRFVLQVFSIGCVEDSLDFAWIDFNFNLISPIFEVFQVFV